MGKSDYWEEAVETSLEDAGISATAKQISGIAGDMQANHENYGMYSGEDVYTGNYKSPSQIELEELKRSIKKKEDWLLSTKPCRSCITTGQVKDVWGRDQICQRCSGEGRHQ